MRREDLEHIIRAAAALTKENDFIIIGSQAILGQYPDAPQALRVSWANHIVGSRIGAARHFCTGSQ